jgi:hypothetical protein
MTAVEDARRVVQDAIAAGYFPAAAIEVGSSAAPIWADAVGTLTFENGEPAGVDTPFDLASLTKVVATTTLAMDLVRTGTLGLDQPVSSFFTDWRAIDREAVTIRDLLEHGASSNTRSRPSGWSTIRGRGRFTATSASSCSRLSRPIWEGRHSTCCSQRRWPALARRSRSSWRPIAAHSPRRHGRWTSTRGVAVC